MGGLSITHLLVVLIIALLLFGAGRVSEIGKGLGEGIRNFKKGIREEDEDQPKAKRKVADDEEEVEVQVVKVPKQLPATEPKKKKVIQIEVDDDASEEEIARRIAAKKKAMAEDEKAT
ncbi:MAG: twin-arginine translocase TatA/TatE family subunit [Minicystis sp.]